MSKYQKKDSNNLVKNKNENKVISNGKQINSIQFRKIIYPDNQKKFKSTNETINYTTKTYYPNIKFSSLNKFKINNLNNKSFNVFNPSNKCSTSNFKNINRNMIVLNSFGSSKDLRKKGDYDNHSIFISGPIATPHPTNIIKFDTEQQFYSKNNLNKNKEEINPNKKATTTLYKKRNDNDINTYTNLCNTPSNDINKTSNTINNDYRTIKKNAFNYKINAITYQIKKMKNPKIVQNLRIIKISKHIIIKEKKLFRVMPGRKTLAVDLEQMIIILFLQKKI